MRFLSMVTAAALLAMASVAFAQSTGSSTPSVTPSYTPSVTPSQTPSVTPSQTPSVTPSQTPSVTPSQTPSVTPSQTPSVTPSETPVGGLSKCENLLGFDKDKCLQQERAGTGGTGTSTGTMGPQNTAPSGTVR
jgi:hypothetical protein